MSNGLWEYDDDDVPPVETANSDEEPIVIDDEEDRHRGRGRKGSKKTTKNQPPKPLPAVGASGFVATLRVPFLRSEYRAYSQMIAPQFSDDEEDQGVLLVSAGGGSDQHAAKRRKTAEEQSAAPAAPALTVAAPAPAPDPRFTRTLADTQKMLADLDKTLFDDEPEEDEEVTVDPNSMEHGPSMRYQLAAINARARAQTEAIPEIPQIDLSSPPAPSAADSSAGKLTIKCQFHGGKALSVLVLPSDTVSTLIKVQFTCMVDCSVLAERHAHGHASLSVIQGHSWCCSFTPAHGACKL